MLDRPVIVILGPTAVGKTRISIDLAYRMAGEVVSADSRLFYRGMDIGTAKPTSEERASVPHHLIDVVDPREEWNLAIFRAEATRSIAEIHERGNLPFVVGGTGQYITALIEGWEPPPRAEDSSYREQLEKEHEEFGSNTLHEKLMSIDPETGHRIDPRNVRRVIRALEIYHVTGQRPSDMRVKSPPDYAILKIGISLPRDELYERIDDRIDDMIANGWVEEVQGLLELEVPIEAPSMSAIGYPQLASYLQGEISLDDVLIEIRRISRQFVRRQANWFKSSDPTIYWYLNEPGVVDRIEAQITEWLGGTT